MAKPTMKVEIAFATAPDDPSPVWVDVTQWLQVNPGISITRGRSDNSSSIPASVCTFTLKNADGRFTPEYISGAYYPNVKKGRKVRVTATHNSVDYIRFTGYIDEWTVDWPSAKTNLAFTQVTASSRKAKLDRGAELRSIIEAEYLQDNPIAYFPLGDSEGTTRAGNVSTTTQPQMAVTVIGAGSTGNVSFGSATGPATDGLTAALFTRVSATAGATLTMTSPTVLIDPFASATGTMLLECFFLTNATQEMGICQADQIGFFPGNAAYYLGTNSSGKLIGVSYSNGVTYTLTSAATVSDGLTHHAALRERYDGTNTVAHLFLDGVSVANTTIAGDWRNTVYRVIGGGGALSANSCYAGTLAHVALTWSSAAISDTRIQQHSLAGSTGFSGEASGARISRLATYAGVATADTDLDTGQSTSIANQETSGQTPLSLMEDVVTTEGGLLFDARDGALTFHDRAHRYNAASVLALSAATGAGEITKDLEPKLDDQNLVNDVTASRDAGVTVRAVDTASVSEYGTYRADVQLLTTSDSEVTDAANWKVNIGSTPRVRIPTVTVGIRRLSTSQATAVLAREISDRITLSNLPPQAPASSAGFFIEGYSETVTDLAYAITFNVSTAELSGVWQLDSSTYSVLNTTTRLAY